ncbi:ParB/RepB/Spo0J family partition protein [Stenotrophomonas acidaminiphila]|uniref:ParB/RepB/Spo0J family partition protein n=1 Tax=Stenotrophomonas acidaminiphila TaxID=128780 RepID=UPI0028B0FAD5|nr:ParB/RepB/Spo0J family partition protein [Stenotrophomonas acidaminiphila]
MERLEALLTEWRTIEPQQVALSRIKEAEAYQPRNVRLAPFRDRGRLEEASEAHVADLASKLGDGRDLDPLLIADIDGILYLIDGHHRLKAYRRAGRQSAPVRIRGSTEAEALVASKAANCDGVKLPMHTEQRREAAWQYLAMLTMQGRQALPNGESLRSIGRTFGVGKDTAARMLRKLSGVNLGDYSADACDPGTGWPQWRHVKGNAWRDAAAEVPETIRERHRDERRAAKLAKMIEQDGLDAFLRSLRLLEGEAIAATADRLAEVMTAGDGDY